MSPNEPKVVRMIRLGLGISGFGQLDARPQRSHVSRAHDSDLTVVCFYTQSAVGFNAKLGGFSVRRDTRSEPAVLHVFPTSVGGPYKKSKVIRVK